MSDEQFLRKLIQFTREMTETLRVERECAEVMYRIAK